ncbi:ABC transporter ATP-binding protein [Sodalis-like secondary symbiont of Drepanosiphum platanoidis]|uniref:ABC transporter ATP-binding protein n=1 Tax=Sodalis-like secondary symbiont of Drepanosiphum platanoidis TaxID=2994493 RepID=UPI0034646399
MFNWFEKLVNTYPKNKKNFLSKNFFLFIWFCTKGIRIYFIIMILLTSLISIFEAFLFSIIGKIIDWLNKIEPSIFWEKEKINLIILLIILILSIFLISIQSMIKHQTLCGNFPMMLRYIFHSFMIKKNIQFYQNEFSGKISSKIMQTAIATRDICMIISEIMVFIIIYFFTMITIIGNFNILMIIPFLIWLFLYIISIYYFVPKQSLLSKNQSNARSLMIGRITDTYNNIITIKLFSNSKLEKNYIIYGMKKFLKTVIKQMRIITSFEIINHFLNIILIITTLSEALWLWSKELISIGAITSVTIMLLRLNNFSHWIMWEISSLFENIGIVQDGINTFSYQNKVNDIPNAKKLYIKNGEIIFKNINFSYNFNKNNNIVLNNFYLKINKGEKIGLIGKSGSGKSTLINLLLRFYDINKGKIIIDNQDISKIKQKSLRRQIGMITQDTSLLNRSIKDNILYGKPYATENEMIDASKKAGAHDFIVSLSDNNGKKGYDVCVGERGVKLSGGQRQRISIARVILKNAPILILDEATSALDSEIELEIQKNLYELMKGKTVISIAHRLSTVLKMDRLIILNNGSIIEEGKHEDLIKNNKLYSRLWFYQSSKNI